MPNKPQQPLIELAQLRQENAQLKSRLLELQNQYNNLERHFLQLRADAKIGDYCSVLELCGVTSED